MKNEESNDSKLKSRSYSSQPNKKIETKYINIIKKIF